jgi:hypothetical protein
MAYSRKITKAKKWHNARKRGNERSRMARERSTAWMTDEKVLRQILWDDHDGFTVVEEVDLGDSRWRKSLMTVFKRNEDGQLFLMYWQRGLTENCDHEYPDKAVPCRVETKTVVVNTYHEIA